MALATKLGGMIMIKQAKVFFGIFWVLAVVTNLYAADFPQGTFTAGEYTIVVSPREDVNQKEAFARFHEAGRQRMPHALHIAPAVADLMGRRLVVCSETNEGGRFDDHSPIGDIRAREGEITVEPPAEGPAKDLVVLGEQRPLHRHGHPHFRPHAQLTQVPGEMVGSSVGLGVGEARGAEYGDEDLGLAHHAQVRERPGARLRRGRHPQRAAAPSLMTAKVVGSGHFLYAAVPDQVAAMLARFFAIAGARDDHVIGAIGRHELRGHRAGFSHLSTIPPVSFA